MRVSRKLCANDFFASSTLAEKLQQHPPDEENFAYTGKDGRKVRLLLSQALTASMCMSAQGLALGGIGVWSPPGSGKTVGAVISSRHRGAKMTLVVCPANVVPMWAGFRCKDEGVFRRGEVQKCYPHILMKAVKNMKDLIDVSRGWVDANGNHGNHGSCDAPRFMVISYGLLQHADAENTMKILAERCSASGFPVEMIIFDEIHLLKWRCTRTEIANRLKAARVLVCRCREIAEAKMFVQGMSATPVINTLHEATSLIDFITTGTSGLPEFSEGAELPRGKLSRCSSEADGSWSATYCSTLRAPTVSLCRWYGAY